MSVPLVVAIAVTLSTTTRPGNGTGPPPATTRSRVSPGPSPTPDLVSSTRRGSSGWKTPASAPGVYQPARSTMTCTLPAALRIETVPSSPTATMTEAAVTAPGAGLRLLTVGAAPPGCVG